MEGPLTDRWGTWVRSIVPLRDPETGPLLAALGLDVAARDRTHSLFRAAALPTSLMLLLGLLIAFLKQMEVNRDRLQVQNERFNKLASQVPGVIFHGRWDEKSDRLAFPYSSGGLYRLSDLEPTDISKDAAPLFDRLEADDRNELVAAMRQSAATLETWSGTFRVRDVGGAERHFGLLAGASSVFSAV